MGFLYCEAPAYAIDRITLYEVSDDYVVDLSTVVNVWYTSHICANEKCLMKKLHISENEVTALN